MLVLLNEVIYEFKFRFPSYVFGIQIDDFVYQLNWILAQLRWCCSSAWDALSLALRSQDLRSLNWRLHRWLTHRTLRLAGSRACVFCSQLIFLIYGIKRPVFNSDHFRRLVKQLSQIQFPILCSGFPSDVIILILDYVFVFNISTFLSGIESQGHFALPRRIRTFLGR